VIWRPARGFLAVVERAGGAALRVREEGIRISGSGCCMGVSVSSDGKEFEVNEGREVVEWCLPLI
jgi:hypothetical protein